MTSVPPFSAALGNQNHHSRTQGSTGPGGTSSRTYSRKLGVRQHKADFAKIWQRFVVAQFECPAHCALVFQVDPSTAENWFEGHNAPSGYIVDLAWRDPDMARALHAALRGAA